jgi:hypothetical protein
MVAAEVQSKRMNLPNTPLLLNATLISDGKYYLPKFLPKFLPKNKSKQIQIKNY